MNNKELLELAAKAAGIEGQYIDFYENDEDCITGIRPASFTPYAWPVWNPLENDGQAFRLMVALKLSLTFEKTYCMVNLFKDHAFNADIAESYDGDENSATRRVIVRAAAEIGKAMP